MNLTHRDIVDIVTEIGVYKEYAAKISIGLARTVNVKSGKTVSNDDQYYNAECMVNECNHSISEEAEALHNKYVETVSGINRLIDILRYQMVPNTWVIVDETAVCVHYYRIGRAVHTNVSIIDSCRIDENGLPVL
jgi:hypothetical protein